MRRSRVYLRRSIPKTSTREAFRVSCPADRDLQSMSLEKIWHATDVSNRSGIGDPMNQGEEVSVATSSNTYADLRPQSHRVRLCLCGMLHGHSLGTNQNRVAQQAVKGSTVNHRDGWLVRYGCDQLYLLLLREFGRENAGCTLQGTNKCQVLSCFGATLVR